MPNLAALTNAQSAVSIGNLIALKSISIVIIRGGVAQPAQTVRLETLSSQRQVTTEGGQVYMCDSYILGYKNHPTIADTSVKPGDRFVNNSISFEVIQVMPGHVDCIQAWLRVRT